MCTEITNLKASLESNHATVRESLTRARESLLAIVDNSERVLEDMYNTSMI
jgi:hypothetical protein